MTACCRAMKILISDDDATSRLLMRRLLRDVLGYEVIETFDGSKAWQALDSGMKVDLCILDMWMPEMTGVELVSKMRLDSRFKSQKVVLCSLENRRDAVQKVASLGISGYLIKPFVSEHFLAKVRQVCEGSQTESAGTALESAEVVTGRLGGGMTTYLDLLNVFTKDVAGLVAELQDQAGGKRAWDWQTRLSGLRGAGQSLAAKAVVSAILRLEKLNPADESSLVRSHIESLKNENDRVISAMKAVASQMEPPENRPPEQHAEPASPLTPAEKLEKAPDTKN